MPGEPKRPSAKLAVEIALRRLVLRTGFDLVRDPFRHRFVYALHQHDVRNVLDIGANVGQFGDELRRAKFTGSILSVEPLADAYRELVAHTGKDPLWSTERAAVSDQPGTITMNVSANSVSSSALPMLGEHTSAADEARYVATEQVPATTVDDLVARHKLDPAVTLLKLDVQGYEKAVLDGAVETLSRFACVRTEMSLTRLYDGQVLMPELVGLLDKHGFELWFVERGFTDPVTRRVLQMDGVFFAKTVTE